MSENRDISENGVNEARVDNAGLSPGRCPVDRARGSGRHHATVREKSTQEDISVMKCYYESKPDEMGYRKRLLDIWEGKGLFNVSEQRLCDQVRQIKKNGWLSQLQLEEIRREIERERLGLMNDDEEQQPGIHNVSEDRPRNEGIDVPTAETQVENDNIRENSESQRKIFDQLTELLKKEYLPNPPYLRHIDRKRVKEACSKVNEVISAIATHNITQTNKLIKAGAIVTAKLLGVKE